MRNFYTLIILITSLALGTNLTAQSVVISNAIVAYSHFNNLIEIDKIDANSDKSDSASELEFQTSSTFDPELLVSFECGDDIGIEVFVEGLEDNSNNCRNISVQGMLGATVEVWIEENGCGMDLPSTIQLQTNNGNTFTAVGVMATQTSASNVPEYIYRAEINQPFNQVCISNLSGCDDATSMAIYAEYTLPNVSSSLTTFDVELHGPPNGVDDCAEAIIVLDGVGSDDREVEIAIPIHEKDNVRAVEITMESLCGSTVITSTTQSFTNQNAGVEASLYVMSESNIDACVDRVRVRVCSPANNGDSFGLGSVSLVTEGCCDATGFDPGSIDNDSSSCGAFNPPTITGTAATGCEGGVIEYRWETRSTAGGSWSQVPGANSRNWDPPFLSSSIWVRRGARCAPCGNFEYSNVLDIHISENYTSGGTISGDQCNCCRFGRISSLDPISLEIPCHRSHRQI